MGSGANLSIRKEREWVAGYLYGLAIDDPDFYGTTARTTQTGSMDPFLLDYSLRSFLGTRGGEDRAGWGGLIKPNRCRSESRKLEKGPPVHV